jgi:hypothetical protein
VRREGDKYSFRKALQWVGNISLEGRGGYIIVPYSSPLEGRGKVRVITITLSLIPGETS